MEWSEVAYCSDRVCTNMFNCTVTQKELNLFFFLAILGPRVGCSCLDKLPLVLASPVSVRATL